MFWIILAGVLALPALLVLVVTTPLVALLSLPSAYLLLGRKKQTRPSSSESIITNDNSHVIITGGSSGIGLAIATCAAQRPTVTKITILARNKERLQQAKHEIQQASHPRKDLVVETVSVSVCDAKALKDCATKLFHNESPRRVFLFCCAGEPLPAKFQDIEAEQYANIVQVNQLGVIYTVHAFLPYMKAGTISLCSSAAGQAGVFGYSAYSPTKFGLRGFAECLHQELMKPEHANVHIQVAYPPDTETPGFAKENIAKPEETKLISQAAGLLKPEQVGNVMLDEAMADHPRFNVYFNFDGFLLSILTAGFEPVTSLGNAVAQLSAMTFTRWIALFYLQIWYGLIHSVPSQTESVNAKKQS